MYFSIGQEWPNNSFHLIRHLSHYYEQIEANITQNYPTKTSWPPWWPHLSQRDVFKTWEWQFDKRTVVNISRTYKAVSNLFGTNAKVGKYHRWNGENRRSLTDSSGGNKHVSGFFHTCVENGKHLQTYNCVAFFTHVCLFPYICVKIQTCVENST